MCVCFLGDQDLPAAVPQYLNVLEDQQPSAARGAEDLNASAALTSEEPDSSLAVNESQALDTLQGETKSSSGTPESSVVGSPDTESPVLVNEYVCITRHQVPFCHFFTI